MDFALTPFSKPPQQHFMIFSNVDFRRLYTTYIFTVLTKHALFLVHIRKSAITHYSMEFQIPFDFGADFQFPISGEGGNKGHITGKRKKKKNYCCTYFSHFLTCLPLLLYDFYFCYSHAVYWYESRAIQ